ncbi:DUF5606 domain-containing protein [Mucilaginibacter sp. HMF5004]|uniref:DUF5606 family protein n=1 Tax=Mucilaginibacter rivuli TaxID=2857527 RepID=UPI001C5E8486|nr:DUF5606 domain-containing protein [Mucilaginibacter rivuli]MBW4888855.1 DUF5606 domain-containing protein [Mucilaginibacter rivuli]
MNLQGIVSVSGKPGLWKALAQNKTGFILESLDEKKTKLVANLSTAKLAALDEITIFGYEDDIKLTDVLAKMKAASSIPDTKADGNKLRQFFREVASDHDEEKVYASDMKKIISWFNILKELPLFNEAPAKAAPVVEEAAVAEPEPAKPAAKKAKETAPAAEPKAAKAPKKKKAE